MIRPEVLDALRRWREVLIGAGVIALGLYWVFVSGGLLRWVGIAVGLIGAALVFSGIQRMRFGAGGGGAGFVQVIEGRVTYFGPLTGGVADLDSLTELSIDHGARPSHWLLRQPGQQPLAIPVDAEGAEALFDIFAALPGMRTEYLLRQLHSDADHKVVVWRAEALRAATPRLH